MARSETFQDWDVTCNQVRCVGAPVETYDGFQLLIYPVDGTPVLEVITPLGIYLKHGVKLLVDEQSLHETELLSCELDGCRAFTGLKSDVLSAFRRGKTVEVSVQTSRSREQLLFSYSLMGFSAAFDQIVEQAAQ